MSSSRRRMKTRMNSSLSSASLAIIARKFSIEISTNSPALTHLPANHGVLARDHREFAGEATWAVCDKQLEVRRTGLQDVQAPRQDNEHRNFAVSGFKQDFTGRNLTQLAVGSNPLQSAQQ